MAAITVRVYGDLRELADAPPDGVIDVPDPGRRSVKDLVESLGIPHTELGMLLVDGRPVGLDAVVSGGERVAVYPWLTTVSAPGGVRLRPPPPTPVRFLVDVHLGRLTRRLRTLGLDAAYDNEARDAELAARAAAGHRILLTRDRELLLRSEVVHGMLVPSGDAEEQALAVVRRYPVELSPFTRCVPCNGELEPVAKEEVLERLPPRTRIEHDRFSRCRSCGQVFWPGSHRDELEPFVVRARAEAALAAWGRAEADR